MEFKIKELLNLDPDEDKVITKIYEELSNHLKNGERIVLDFKGIDILYTAFFNDTIGRLFLTFDILYLLNHLTVKNINSDDASLLRYSINEAIKKRSAIEKNTNKPEQI